MYCTHCLGKLPDGAPFCPHCGKPTKASAPQRYETDMAFDPHDMAEKIPSLPPEALWQEVAGDTPRPAEAPGRAQAEPTPKPQGSPAPEAGPSGARHRPEASRKRGRGPWVPIIAVILAVAALVAVVMVFFRPGGGEGQASAPSTPGATVRADQAKGDKAQSTTRAKGDDAQTDAEAQAMAILSDYGLAGLTLPEGTTVLDGPQYLESHAPSALHTVLVRSTSEALDVYDFTELVARHAADNGLELYSNDASFSMDGKASKLADFSFNSTIYGIIYVYEGTQYLLHIHQPNWSPSETTFKQRDIVMTFSLSEDALAGGGDSAGSGAAAPHEDEASAQALDILAGYGFAGFEPPQGASVFDNPEYAKSYDSAATNSITVRGGDQMPDIFAFVDYVGQLGARNGITFYALNSQYSQLEAYTFKAAPLGVYYVYNGQQYHLVVESKGYVPILTSYQEGDLVLTFIPSDVELGGGN